MMDKLTLLFALFIWQSPLTLMAQYDSAPLKSKYGKVRFISDSRSANWFMTFGAGGQSFLSSNYAQKSENIHPGGSLSIGKMMTPEWGLRLNTNGGEVIDLNQKLSYGTVNLDMLLNLATLSRGYKEWRLFEFSIFGGPGYLHTFPGSIGYSTHKATAHLGFMLSFRTSRFVNLNLEVQNNIAKLPIEEGVITTATAGINIKIGKRRYTAYVPEEILSEQSYKETLLLQSEIKKLKEQVAKSESNPKTALIHDTIYMQPPAHKPDKKVLTK